MSLNYGQQYYFEAIKLVLNVYVGISWMHGQVDKYQSNTTTDPNIMRLYAYGVTFNDISSDI